MFSRILVPLDGSQLSERALPHAVNLAKIFHATIVLLQVLEPEHNTEKGRLIEPLSWQIHKAESDLYLRGLAASLADEGLEVDHQIMEGRTPESIVQFAQTNHIDLVVISSHGQSGLSRWNAGSVVNKVIEKLYLPLLIVRAYQTLEEPGAQIRYQKMLLPFDCSKRAECALQVAIAIAQSNESEVVLAHVLRRPDLPESGPYAGELSRMADDLMQLSRTAYNALMNEMHSRIPQVTETCLIESDSIPGAVNELADQQGADLVIFCAHGQTGQSNWPYGSVARNYIEHGSRSVLVMQDIPPSLVKPTLVELAAEKHGSRG